MSEPAVAAPELARTSDMAAGSARRWWILGVVGLAQLHPAERGKAFGVYGAIAGDVAAEEGTFTGTHQGVLHSPAGDIPPTGRPVALDYIQVLRYRDGKHVSFNLMFDRLLMLEQLGLIPAPAPAG